MPMVREIGLARNLDEFKAALQYFDIGSPELVSGPTLWAILPGSPCSEIPIREDLAQFHRGRSATDLVIRDGTGAAANEWLPVMNPQPNQALDFEILPFDEMPQLVNPA